MLQQRIYHAYSVYGTGVIADIIYIKDSVYKPVLHHVSHTDLFPQPNLLLFLPLLPSQQN